MTTVLSIVESPLHRDFTTLFERLSFQPFWVNSIRKGISAAKKEKPDVIIAEFFYGYGNNYAGVHISNLDVLLYTLQRYAPDTRVIVMVEKAERQYVDKLNEILPLAEVLVHPVTDEAMEKALQS